MKKLILLLWATKMVDAPILRGPKFSHGFIRYIGSREGSCIYGFPSYMKWD